MKRAVVVVVAALLTFGCKKPSEKKGEDESASKAEAGHADEKEHEGLPKRVRLTPAVIAAAGIKTAPVTKTALAESVDLPGEIAADPDHSAQIGARMAGRLERVTVQEGAAVKAGDLIAVVRAPEAGELSSAAQSLGARAAAARGNATRLEALLKSGLASQQEVVTAKAEADALEAEARAARERAGALGAGASGASLALRSPIAGIVVARHAVVGQPVTADQTIATVVDLGHVWFLARLFEQNLSRVRVGAKAEVRLNAFPEEAFSGVVDYVASQIDPSARTVVARIRLENRKDMLRLGLFGSARIDTGAAPTHAPSIVIPRTAIVEIGGKRVVFVRHPDDDFELHEIVLGASGLGRVEVLAGLREGEDLVVEGVFTLKSAVLKATLAEED